MFSELMIVLNDVIKIIKYVKSQPLKSRLSKLICMDLQNNQATIILSCCILKSLSGGRAFPGLMELCAEVEHLGLAMMLNF